MKKTIVLGYVKLPYEEKRRKAIVKIELKNTDGKYKLSMCGEIKKYSWGQCNGEFRKYIVTQRQNFDRIMEVWEKYHLNDMHAGTPKQEKFVRAYCKNHSYDYGAICEELKKAGLYEDNGYRYGSGWLYEPIPESVLDEIFSW